MRTSRDSDSAGYHHGDLPNALLAAVAEIVEEKGAANVSLREAARRAGVSHSAPAHHFGDKEGMLAAFAERGFEILGREMATGRDSVVGGSALERLAAVGTAYVRFAVDCTSYFDVMFRSGIDTPSHEHLHACADKALAVLIGAVGELISEGGYTEADPRQLTVYFWSLAHGLASLAVDRSMPPGLDELTIDDYIAGVFGMSELFNGTG
ncbi:MAG: TetR/AcrR family transcriptional regulator [Acidobacteria bacterium]|nr:TetR/AcrR family transcriptional regulator [Acidobacteriota bacterium]